MPVTITLTNYLALDPRELPWGVVEQVQERLSFLNPVWLKDLKRSYSNWQVSRSWGAIISGAGAAPGAG